MFIDPKIKHQIYKIFSINHQKVILFFVNFLCLHVCIFLSFLNSHVPTTPECILNQFPILINGSHTNDAANAKLLASLCWLFERHLTKPPINLQPNTAFLLPVPQTTNLLASPQCNNHATSKQYFRISEQRFGATRSWRFRSDSLSTKHKL